MAVAAEPAELDVSPGLDAVRELAGEFTLVPLRHTYIDDIETPVSAYLKLRGEGPSFLLESAEQGQRFGRWSFIGVQPRTVIRLEDGDLTVGGVPRAAGDPYSAVRDELSRYRVPPLEGLPPFAGGAVGLFGYDLVRHVEPTVGPPNPDELGAPDMALMISDVLLAFDHFTHEVTVLANVFVDDDLERRYREALRAIADVRERLAAPVPRARAEPRQAPVFRSNLGADGYAATVERAKEYIRAGDVYQVVPSQRWSAPAPVEAFSIYRGLRTVNPSPYMYFLHFEDFEIAGASPEPLIKVSGDRAEQRPVAGTRPRAATVEEDLERARELLGDEKERAEHVMLVDLARNDLGRVCEYGSVDAPALCRRQAHPGLDHMVSTVRGRLRRGVGWAELLGATFPPGSVTGAPKLAALEMIDRLEPASRGVYCGTVGWVDTERSIGELNVAIRTFWVDEGRLHLGTGAGITWDSTPEGEWEETQLKARRLLSVASGPRALTPAAR